MAEKNTEIRFEQEHTGIRTTEMNPPLGGRDVYLKSKYKVSSFVCISPALAIECMLLCQQKSPKQKQRDDNIPHASHQQFLCQ